MSSRHRELLFGSPAKAALSYIERAAKFVSARRRNQHSRRVRYPRGPGDGGAGVADFTGNAKVADGEEDGGDDAGEGVAVGVGLGVAVGVGVGGGGMMFSQ